MRNILNKHPPNAARGVTTLSYMYAAADISLEWIEIFTSTLTQRRSSHNIHVGTRSRFLGINIERSYVIYNYSCCHWLWCLGI